MNWSLSEYSTIEIRKSGEVTPLCSLLDTSSLFLIEFYLPDFLQLLSRNEKS